MTTVAMTVLEAQISAYRQREEDRWKALEVQERRIAEILKNFLPPGEHRWQDPDNQWVLHTASSEALVQFQHRNPDRVVFVALKDGTWCEDLETLSRIFTQLLSPTTS